MKASKKSRVILIMNNGEDWDDLVGQWVGTATKEQYQELLDAGTVPQDEDFELKDTFSVADMLRFCQSRLTEFDAFLLEGKGLMRGDE